MKKLQYLQRTCCSQLWAVLCPSRRSAGRAAGWMTSGFNSGIQPRLLLHPRAACPSQHQCIWFWRSPFPTYLSARERMTTDHLCCLSCVICSVFWQWTPWCSTCRYTDSSSEDIKVRLIRQLLSADKAYPFIMQSILMEGKKSIHWLRHKLVVWLDYIADSLFSALCKEDRISGTK